MGGTAWRLPTERYDNRKKQATMETTTITIPRTLFAPQRGDRVIHLGKAYDVLFSEYDLDNKATIIHVVEVEDRRKDDGTPAQV